MQQKVVEEHLASQESDIEDLTAAEVVVLPDKGSKEAIIEGLEELDVGDSVLDVGDSEVEDLEMEIQDKEEDRQAVGFFNEEDKEEAQADEDMRIGARVVARRQGCLHNGGGQME